MRHYCDQFGRDFNSVQIIARPGDKYDITPETHARHQELGIDHLVVDTTIKQEDPDQTAARKDGTSGPGLRS
ncbi:MAG: hypothetical protein U0401_01105 [Anaerolineae bacterium]